MELCYHHDSKGESECPRSHCIERWVLRVIELRTHGKAPTERVVRVDHGSAGVVVLPELRLFSGSFARLPSAILEGRSDGPDSCVRDDENSWGEVPFLRESDLAPASVRTGTANKTTVSGTDSQFWFLASLFSSAVPAIQIRPSDTPIDQVKRPHFSSSTDLRSDSVPTSRTSKSKVGYDRLTKMLPSGMVRGTKVFAYGLDCDAVESGSNFRPSDAIMDGHCDSISPCHGIVVCCMAGSERRDDAFSTHRT